MAVQSDTSSISYTGNNSTVTSYAVPFVFLENAHLAATAKVTATGVETAVTLTNHTGAGDVNGGTVRTAVAVPATSTLTIFRIVPATQTTTYQEGGDFPAASHERALDKLTFLAQQNARKNDRAIRVTEADGSRNDMVAVANSLVGLDANKQPKAMTLSEVKSYLALTGTTLSVPAGMKTFADAGERALAVPDFTGQIATQRDTNDVYISTGTAAGNWSLVDENMSLADFASGFFTADATGRGKFANSFVNTALVGDKQVTSSKLAYDGGPMSGFRNAIINGNFDIWQRGTSFNAATTEYGSDRWVKALNGSTCTLSRQSFSLGQTDVPNEPTYFCRLAVTTSAGANNNVILSQRIESVRSFAGQSATISFYAKADAAKPIALEFVQFFGTGGSPSSVITSIGSQKFNLTTSWQKFTATISVPPISGKTIGSNDNDYLEVNIYLDAGSNFNSRTGTLGQRSGTFDIAQVQIEAGSVATPFERRPIGAELALCQRYYQTFGQGANGRVQDATNVELATVFATRMRATPTITFGGFTGAATLISQYGTSNITTSALALSYPTAAGSYIRLTTSGAGSGNIACCVFGDVCAASAEL
jgi:hypothetical protein